LVGKPEGKRPLERPRRRWENQIKMNRVGRCEHGNEPSGSIKDREFLDKLSDCQFLKKDYTPWG
jgi:hypothetical protein